MANEVKVNPETLADIANVLETVVGLAHERLTHAPNPALAINVMQDALTAIQTLHAADTRRGWAEDLAEDLAALNHALRDADETGGAAYRRWPDHEAVDVLAATERVLRLRVARATLSQ